jgi:hypothetical protein
MSASARSAQRRSVAGAAQDEDTNDAPRNRAAPTRHAFPYVLYGDKSALGDRNDNEGRKTARNSAMGERKDKVTRLWRPPQMF